MRNTRTLAIYTLVSTLFFLVSMIECLSGKSNTVAATLMCIGGANLGIALRFCMKAMFPANY